MGSVTPAEVNALLVGLCGGAGYFVAARAMEVATLRIRGTSMVGAMLGGFLLRLVLAAGTLWALIAYTGLHAGALSIGFLTAYTVILGWETLRHVRGASGQSRVVLHGRE